MENNEIERLFWALIDLPEEVLEKKIEDSFTRKDSDEDYLSVFDLLIKEKIECISNSSIILAHLETIYGKLREEYHRDGDPEYLADFIYHLCHDLRRDIRRIERKKRHDIDSLKDLMRTSYSSLNYFSIKKDYSAYYNPYEPAKSLELCIKEINKREFEIKKIIHQNPQKSKYVLEVVQLIAPAIAQSYKGIPALAIVGCIILLFKQCIFNFLDSDLEKKDNDESQNEK